MILKTFSNGWVTHKILIHRQGHIKYCIGLYEFESHLSLSLPSYLAKVV